MATGLDQAGVNALYNELFDRNAVFGGESDFDADWWLGQSEEDVRRGLTSSSEYKNRQQLIDNAGEGGISEMDLDSMVLPGGIRTSANPFFNEADPNADNTWIQGIRNSNVFGDNNNVATNQATINQRLGIGGPDDNTFTNTQGGPIVGTANATGAVLPTIQTPDGKFSYGGGLIGQGGPGTTDDNVFIELVDGGNNNGGGGDNTAAAAIDAATSIVNGTQQRQDAQQQNQAANNAAEQGWWNQFNDFESFKAALNDTGDQQTQQTSQFDQFLKFMQALQGMGGFGGGSGYGYGGYGGFAPGGVRPNTGMNNIMNALNAFKFLGSGGGQNVTTGLQNLT